MSARILVVDDIEANRRLLKAKLEARYFEVVEAPNGHVALEKAVAEKPDIILLDIMMPGLDGYQVCERLKADDITVHIPVVMLTALNERDDRLRGLQVGADDFITKPFDDFELFSRIDALSRYNMVACELRQREASGLRSGFLKEIDPVELSRPSRIVLVDANPATEQRMRSILKPAGHEVAGLQDTGLGDALENTVDIIILSLIDQPFDPLKLCARFKMNERTRAVAIIVVADPSQPDIAYRALDLGASDIIRAPIDRDELLARVTTQSRRTRYIDILRRRVDQGMELAVIDALTGLYNRRFMVNHLKQCLQRSSQGDGPFSVLLADIDHFKKVNDTFGHDVGDQVLREFGNRLKYIVRPGDVVCRQGGEEFAVLMPNTSGDLACTVAERVRRAVAAEPFEVEDAPTQLNVTVSLGVSTFQSASDTGEEILRRADEALYNAKLSGRNRVESAAA